MTILTSGTLSTLLGMVVVASAALWGMVRGLATDWGNRPFGSAFVGCASVFLAQCSFAAWPVFHYLDRLDGHTDFTGTGLRTISQLVWIWLLGAGFWLLVQSAVPGDRRQRAPKVVQCERAREG